MANYYTKSMLSRVSRLEQRSDDEQEPVLFIDMNNDGTYGEQSFTQLELEKYVEANHYNMVLIDDIL